jgi:hypothetical protein
MGRVYVGASPGGRTVAIKVIHPHYAGDQEFRRRFAREVAAARLVGGFHAALVVDADPDAASPWMATAYISGPTLAAAVAQRGPFNEARVRELGAALAEGLAAMRCSRSTTVWDTASGRRIATLNDPSLHTSSTTTE